MDIYALKHEASILENVIQMATVNFEKKSQSSCYMQIRIHIEVLPKNTDLQWDISVWRGYFI